MVKKKQALARASPDDMIGLLGRLLLLDESQGIVMPIDQLLQLCSALNHPAHLLADLAGIG
eukprot:9304243-Prorocentrum_lima.AAC.1